MSGHKGKTILGGIQEWRRRYSELNGEAALRKRRDRSGAKCPTKPTKKMTARVGKCSLEVVGDSERAVLMQSEYFLAGEEAYNVKNAMVGMGCAQEERLRGGEKRQATSGHSRGGGGGTGDRGYEC